MPGQGREERITYSSHGHPTGQSKSGHDEPPWSPDGCPQPCLAPPIPKETQHAAELPHLSTSQLLPQAACRNASTTQQSRLQVGPFSCLAHCFKPWSQSHLNCAEGDGGTGSHSSTSSRGEKGLGKQQPVANHSATALPNLSTPGAETGEGAATHTTSAQWAALPHHVNPQGKPTNLAPPATPMSSPTKPARSPTTWEYKAVESETLKQVCMSHKN